jgi:hypothetical protein
MLHALKHNARCEKDIQAMTAILESPTAKIYQFPLRPRRLASDSTGQARTVAPSTRLSTAYGDGWYHEAAVREQEKPSKR